MSSLGRWSYTNTATVRPFVSEDLLNGGTLYGEPYTIDCTWTALSTQQRDQRGQEFVSKYEIFCEDPRPKYRDLIQLNGDTREQEIRSVTQYDMSFFGENADFKLVT